MDSHIKKNSNKGMLYKGFPRERVIKIYLFAMHLMNKCGFGQRRIAVKIKQKFMVDISESTISGWIHQKNVPFANEKTQFKPKPMPKKAILKDLYINKSLSASKIAKKFKVSTVIIINWLRNYGIKPRKHIESMNTPNIKQELGEKRLIFPTKNYSKLTQEKAYILGVLAGDGYISEKAFKLEIRNDIEFAKEFAKCLNEVYGTSYTCRYYGHKNSYIVEASSKIICKDLLNYGDFKTKTWKVPDIVTDFKNKKVIASYLKGLYDSEGSVSKYRISFASDSRNGICGVKKLLSKLQINSRLYHNKNDHYVLLIGRRENRDKFKELIGFTIKRKMQRL